MKNLALPPESVAEFRALIETYDRVRTDTKSDGPPGTLNEIELLRKRLDSRDLYWTDLAQAELCVLEILDPYSLQTRLGGWRRRMHEVIGDSRYAAYMTTACDPKTADAPTLKGEIAECVRAVYYFYNAYGIAARSRSGVTRDVLLVCLALVAIEALVAVALVSRFRGYASLHDVFPATVAGLEFMLAASASAVVGSVISVQSRLQDPRVEVDPLYRYIQTRADRLSIAVISPLFAAAFGILIYGLIASGLIGGNAFPRFDRLISARPPITDIALVFVYGFLAGFAERLVPDALTRLAARTLASIATQHDAVPESVAPRGP